MRLLLVDDDAATRRLLDAMLVKMGHEVVHAVDGLQAWEILQKEQINLVLSDWVMPRMDGVELCRKLRSVESNHYTYVILFTGKDQTEDLIVGMEAGADDFLTKPVAARELEVRIDAGARVLSLENTLKARNEQLSLANRALEQSQQQMKRDLQAAAAIQQDLLPKTRDIGLAIELGWDYVPTDELAGDIFNFFRLDDTYMAFYLADVSGHGVPAAMLAVQLARTIADSQRPPLSTQQLCFHKPSEVATLLNQQFQEEDGSLLYFTMVYGVINTSTGEGSMCQAGHPYPVICRSSGQVERLGSGGFPIGLLPDASYQQFEFQLGRGDALLLYSDGLTECINDQGEAFGEQRLADSLVKFQQQPLQDVVTGITRQLTEWHQPGASQARFSDDVSMLAIRR